jgi:hypothetical protein
MPGTGAIPIPNSTIAEEIKYHNPTEVDLKEYLETYTQWIVDSKRNQLTGLENYVSKSFIHGTVQGFDHFYIKHFTRRFRFFRGEFMYHQASMKAGLAWAWLNDGNIESNDAVIISVPFSDFGSKHTDLDSILDICESLEVPVLLDFAYLAISKNIVVNLNYKCIDSVCTSISKAFDGAQYLRCGIRFQRENLDDGIDAFNSVGMVPHKNMSTAVYLMKKYSIDYNWDAYATQYELVCKEFNLQPTDCILFGLSTEYAECNRGNILNRVCISKDLV